MQGNLQNLRKVIFFNTIKTKETSIIYKDFIRMDEIKKKKLPQQDTDRKKIILEIKPFDN